MGIAQTYWNLYWIWISSLTFANNQIKWIIGSTVLPFRSLCYVVLVLCLILSYFSPSLYHLYWCMVQHRASLYDSCSDVYQSEKIFQCLEKVLGRSLYQVRLERYYRKSFLRHETTVHCWWWRCFLTHFV